MRVNHRGLVLRGKRAVRALPGAAKKLSQRSLIGVTSLILAFTPLAYVTFVDPKKSDALDSAKMIIFWEGTDASIPTGQGWSKVTSINGHNVGGEYPRGETPANVVTSSNSATYGGAATHALTVSNTTITSVHPTFHESGAQAVAAASTHVHSFSNPSVGTGTNEPQNRALKMIIHTGIPTQIPSGGIVMFDTAPGAGWTRVSDQDNYMIKIDTSSTGAITGPTGTGSDTHTHSVAWSSLGASTGTANKATVAGGSAYVPDGHTHAAPANPSATPAVSHLPPNVKPLLYKANSDITAPTAMITMFDSNPGGGWAVQSNTGGTFYQQFFRPASTYDGTTTGTSTHNHADIQSDNTVTPTAVSAGTQGSTGPLSTQIHSHYMVSSFTQGSNHLPPYFNIVVAKKALPSMLLFWDGADTDIPAGWTRVTDYDGRFPRGEASGNSGDTGGNATHTHTNQSLSMSAPSATRGAALGSNTGSTAGHAHSTQPTINTISSESNNPSYRELKLIKFIAGIPNIIPAGGITIFDSTPGIPTTEIIPGGAFDPYWSQYTSQNDRMVKINNGTSTAINGSNCTAPAVCGGSDTHTQTVTWSGSFSAATGTTSTCLIATCNGPNVSSNGHTHTAPGSTASTSGSNLPPYIGVLMAKLNADTPTLSSGLTALFTGDPGSGWVIQSSSGGKYYQKFLRPQATYDQAGGGVTSHTHTATGISGAGSGSGVTANNGTVGALTTHTHDMLATFTAGTAEANYTADNNYFLPQFFNVIVAEKVDFKLEDYAWFEDTNAEDVSDPWSVLNVPAHNTIPTLPTAYKPPDRTFELRLRIKILVNNNNLDANQISYKLQYKKGNDAKCDTGTWADVGASGGGVIWRFASSGVTDGQVLSTSRFSPTSTVLQVYSKSNPTATNPYQVIAGNTMEWDFHIEHNGAEGATQYSFRVVEDTGVPDDGTTLSEYTYCPTLSTKPQAADQMRHGNFFEKRGDTTTQYPGIEAGFSWVD